MGINRPLDTVWEECETSPERLSPLRDTLDYVESEDSSEAVSMTSELQYNIST